MRQGIWVFGNAVQDITVEADMDRLSREIPELPKYLRVRDDVIVERGLWFETSFGQDHFAVECVIRPEEREQRLDLEGRPAIASKETLVPGHKYTLVGAVVDQLASPVKSHTDPILVSCEGLSWGGGGLNAVTFLRAIAPDPERVPVLYSDVAMSNDLPYVTSRFDQILSATQNEPAQELWTIIDDLIISDPARAERLIAQIARYAAAYRPDRSLEVYLASLPIESLLYRRKELLHRRNWIFSRFRSTAEQRANTKDKIILRGHHVKLKDEDEGLIQTLLAGNTKAAGAVLLDSLRDGPMFRAAYNHVKHGVRTGSVVGLLAMTAAMQDFFEWIKLDSTEGLPPFILLFDWEEAVKMGPKVVGGLEPFASGTSDMPKINEFARFADALRRLFRHKHPRIYITLGSLGSIGVDNDGTVIYVECYKRISENIVDTSGCGDAYCAAITLLEWARRNGWQDIGGKPGERLSRSNEMLYFMAVASAAAYCKAINPKGRIIANDVLHVLDNVHIGSEVHLSVEQLVDGEKPINITQDGLRFGRPLHARIMGATPELRELTSTKIKNHPL